MSIELLRVDLSVGKSRNIGKLSILERSCSLASCRAFAVLFIGCDVEGNKEKKVRADNAHARESRKLFSGALPRIWHVWEVGRGEVSVRCEVDESCSAY